MPRPTALELTMRGLALQLIGSGHRPTGPVTVTESGERFAVVVNLIPLAECESTPTDADDGDDMPELGRIAKAILAVLRSSDARLTTARIHAKLLDKGQEWSLRTVKAHLAELIDKGLIDNDQDENPPGYGIL